MNQSVILANGGGQGSHCRHVRRRRADRTMS